MRKRAKNTRPETIGEILLKIVRKRHIPHNATDRKLRDLWNRAVGPQIASRTLPEALRRGALHVRVSAPVWLHQLQFLKEEILGRLREISGSDEIRSLFFAIGEVPVPPARADAAPPVPPDLAPLKKRDREMMRQCLDSLADPELRAIVERVMTREISRRREGEARKGR
jgi:hypothetical protein